MQIGNIEIVDTDPLTQFTAAIAQDAASYLDLLLADLPPGAAADKPPAIVGFLPELDGAVVVTTPSEVSTDVVRKSIVYARDVGIRVVGLIENMSGFLCPECRAESDLFEGHTNVEELCTQLEVSLLGRIPLDRKINQACDRGIPLLEESEPITGRFQEIAEKIAQHVKMKRNEPSPCPKSG